MRPARSAAVLLLLCTISVAKSPKKSDLNRIITQARHVMVTTYYGNGVANLSTPTQDRQAMLAMEQAFKKWGRYHVVYQPEMADIIVLVRKGRYAGLTGGGAIGVGTGGEIRIGSPLPAGTPGTIPDNRPVGAGGGVYGGVDAGMPDDELAVYDAHLGLDTCRCGDECRRKGCAHPSCRYSRNSKNRSKRPIRRTRQRRNHSRDGACPVSAQELRSQYPT